MSLRTGIEFLIVIYWIVVIIALIAEDRDPTTTLAWILVLCLLPGFGLVLYFFAGRDWAGITLKSDYLRDLLKIQRPFMGQIYATYCDQAEDLATRVDGTFAEKLLKAIEAENGAGPLPAASIEVWATGEEYFPELIADISRAEKFVHMQYFIWERDELTAKICDALMERLKAGVEVRILNDFLGNIQYKKDQLEALRDAGAKWSSDQGQIAKLNYRNHRKITVIDGVIGHSGGVNIGQEYIDGGEKYPTWRDTGMRITGPAVLRLQDLFAHRWFEVEKVSLYNERYFPAWEGDPGTIMTQIVAQGVEDPWSSSSRAYEIAMGAARDKLLIQSPYYVPTESMQAALVNAALSGVEVHFMMTGWPDKKIAFNAAKSYWNPLLKAGGHVWLYDAGFFHAKSIVVDGEAAAIGTMNMDTRSLSLHKELMVWVYDKEFATINEKIFYDDLSRSHEVTLEEVEAYTAGDRFRNSAARLASKLI